MCINWIITKRYVGLTLNNDICMFQVSILWIHSLEFPPDSNRRIDSNEYNQLFKMLNLQFMFTRVYLIQYNITKQKIDSYAHQCFYWKCQIQSSRGIKKIENSHSNEPNGILASHESNSHASLLFSYISSYIFMYTEWILLISVEMCERTQSAN